LCPRRRRHREGGDKREQHGGHDAHASAIKARAMRRRRETRAARFGNRRFEDVIFEASAGKTKDAEEIKRRLAFLVSRLVSLRLSEYRSSPRRFDPPRPVNDRDIICLARNLCI
jgi:hypothetical protein